MMSDSAMTQTPFDMIDLNDLEGWIRYDSSRMREENNGKGLGGDSGDRYQNPWIRFDNS